MKKYIFLIACFALLAIPIYAAVTANNWTVTIVSELHDIDYHEVIIEVQNLQDVNKDFGLGVYLQSMSFDESELHDLYVYEWKPVAKDYAIYEATPTDCLDKGMTGCTYNNLVGYESLSRLEWKPTKMALITQPDKVEAEYGNILIPKSSSKCKYDDFGGEYDCSGTKTFKISWKTPLQWKSEGYYAIYDTITGYDYDPWWNTSWEYCKDVDIDVFGTDIIPIWTNITGIRLETEYEGRLVDAECGNGGTAQEYTIIDNSTGDAGNDYAYIVFEYDESAGNDTWSFYYNNSDAEDPSYEFLLFDADMTALSISATTNTSFQWHSDDVAKYSVQAGYLNCSHIDNGAFNTDQLQTQADFSSYADLTIYAMMTDMGAGGSVYSNRYIAGTITHGTWDNYYNLLANTDNPDEWRLVVNFPAEDFDSNVDVIAGNVSYTVQYDQTNDDADMWIKDSDDNSEKWSKNTTSVAHELKYWGLLTDYGSAGNQPIFVYKFYIFDSYVMPRETSLPTITLGGEETPATGAAPFWSSNTSSLPANYHPTTYSMFNVTWQNGSAISPVNTTTANITLNGADHTMTLVSGNGVSGVYGYANILGAGTYQWNHTAESNTSQSNTTDTWSFTIAKAATNCTLSFDPASPTNYNNLTTATCICDNPEGTTKLYRNGSDVTGSENNTAVKFGVAAYAYICNSTETGNYTSDSDSSTYIVNPSNPNLNLSFNDTSPAVIGVYISITCESPAGEGVSAAVWNDTHQLGGFPYNLWNTTGLSAGTYNFTCNSSASQNYTTGTTNTSMILVLEGALVIDHVFDENDLSNHLNFSVEIFNSTYSAQSNYITSYNNNEVLGDLTVVISAPEYGTRTYHVNVPITSLNMSGYLVNDTDGHTITFTVKNYYDTLLDDVNITVQRLLPTWVTVGDMFTDAAGISTFYADDNANYKLIITRDGYTTIEREQQLPLSAYTIYMSSGLVEKPSYWDFYKTLYSDCSFDNSTRVLNCTWADTSGHIANTTLEVLTYNATDMWTLCSNTSTNASGSFYCSFGAMNNQTFLWSMWSDTASDPSDMLLASGSWTDLLPAIALGVTGIMIAMLIIIFSGFIGVQMGSPIITVIMTTLGVGASAVMGFLDLGTSAATILMGLTLSGGIMIWKMRSDEK